MPATEQGLILTRGAHRTDRLAVVADAVEHAADARIEVEVPRVARIICVERSRPVIAVGACVVEFTVPAVIEPIVPAVASGRKEERLAVLLRGEKSTLHAILCRPLVGGVVQQFFPLLLARRAPAAAPVGLGRVITALQGGQVVGETIVAEVGLVAVLG